MRVKITPLAGGKLMLVNPNIPLDKMVNAILRSAVNRGVNEIQIQRQKLDVPVQEEIQGLPTPLSYTRDEGVFVLFRIAGQLEKQLDLPEFVTKPLFARIQELSNTEISEQHGFPEGRLQFEQGTQRYDWQVLVGPNKLGEQVVLRQIPGNV